MRTPPTALIYARVSKDADNTSKSIDQQVDELTAWAEREGWQVKKILRETASASRYAAHDRPEFNRALDLLDTGDYDLFLTWEHSRALRKLDTLVRFRNVCRDNGVLWGFQGKLHDFNDIGDALITGIQTLLSEDEVARTSIRIQRDVAARAREGAPHGKNLYGYMRIYDPKTRQRTDIVEEPQQAAIVREIFTRVAAHEPINAIAKDFNTRGIPTRRPVNNPEREGQGWISQSIKQVVTNKSYIGIRVHKGTEYPSQWPALVDQELFDTANAILADPRRDTRKAKADFEAKHLLSGIARCAVCGAKMGTAKQNAGRKRVDKDTGEVLPRQTYRSYLCQGLGPASTGPRFHVSMKEVSLDTLVEAAVIARLSRPDFLATLDEGGEDDVADRRAAIHTEIEKLESYLEAVRQRAAQELDMNLLFDQERRIKPELERLQAELTSLVEIDPLVVELAAENDVAARWEALPLETKRQVIRALMDVRVAKPTLPKGSTALDMGRVQITWLH